MKITNIDLTKPNWREEAKKISKYPIEFTLIQDIEEPQPRYISSMSGGLEHKLAKGCKLLCFPQNHATPIFIHTYPEVLYAHSVKFYTGTR